MSNGFGYQRTTTTRTGVEDLSDAELDKFNRLIFSETQRRGNGVNRTYITENIEVPPPNLLSPTSSPTRFTEVIEPLSAEDALIDEEIHTTGYKVLTYKRIVPIQGSVTKRQYEAPTVIDPPPQVVRTRTTTSLPVQQQYVVTPTAPVVTPTVPIYTTPTINPSNQVTTTTTRRAIFPGGM